VKAYSVDIKAEIALSIQYAHYASITNNIVHRGYDGTTASAPLLAYRNSCSLSTPGVIDGVAGRKHISAYHRNFQNKRRHIIITNGGNITNLSNVLTELHVGVSAMRFSARSICIFGNMTFGNAY
jgi:hypothetical protein